ncbi:polysaccharide deacetylase family protein [Actinopolymorpha pittospori]
MGGPTSSPTPYRCPTPAESAINSAPGTGKTVALTFDDGAAPAMLSVADILRTKGVTATFFNTGAHDSANPDVVRQVASMGFLIANHTWDHDYPAQTSSGWTVEYLRDQMARTSALQQRLTGRPVCFFRPPGGNLTNVLTAASAEGMSTVLWSVDARDWAQPGQNDPESVAKIVERATSLDPEDDQHPIVLMHVAKASHEPESQVSSFRGNTIAALPQIIDWYADHGYRFVDLLGHDAPPTPVQ